MLEGSVCKAQFGLSTGSVRSAGWRWSWCLFWGMAAALFGGGGFPPLLPLLGAVLSNYISQGVFPVLHEMYFSVYTGNHSLCKFSSFLVSSLWHFKSQKKKGCGGGQASSVCHLCRLCTAFSWLANPPRCSAVRCMGHEGTRSTANCPRGIELRFGMLWWHQRATS